MNATPTRRTRLLAGLGAAVVTVGIIVAASLGYNAWKSDDEPNASVDPTVSPTVTTSPTEPSPTEASPTEQSPPDDADPETDDGSEKEPPQDEPEDEGDHGHDETTDTGPPEWKVVLDGFARDFNKATGSAKKWQKKMARWVTPHLAGAYKSVDPRMLPNTRIDKTVIQSEGTEAVTAIIHYHGIQPVWVHLQPTPDGWRVTEAEPYTGN